MKNKIEYLNVSLALTLLSLALLHVQSSSYPLESIIHVAKAAETAEERAHEENGTGNVQNGFSPASPEETQASD